MKKVKHALNSSQNTKTEYQIEKMSDNQSILLEERHF